LNPGQYNLDNSFHISIIFKIIAVAISRGRVIFQDQQMNNTVSGRISSYGGWRMMAVLAASFLPLAGCGLEYAGESFTMSINKDGSGVLSVQYKNFGSSEKKSHLRQSDLNELRDAAQGEKYVSRARENGVDIKDRRLEFVNYTLNGYLEAEAGSYHDFFKVFTHYKLEIDDRMYLTPLNGTVSRAKLGKGGQIVIRNKRYAFAWPLGTKEIAFDASYIITGASFSYEYQKRFKQK